MLQGILIVVAFLVVAALLMMTKKIPTLLALPLMAVVICIIAGVPMFGKNADGAEIGWRLYFTVFSFHPRHTSGSALSSAMRASTSSSVMV